VILNVKVILDRRFDETKYRKNILFWSQDIYNADIGLAVRPKNILLKVKTFPWL